MSSSSRRSGSPATPATTCSTSAPSRRGRRCPPRCGRRHDSPIRRPRRRRRAARRRRPGLQLRGRHPPRAGAGRRPEVVPAHVQGVLRRPVLRPGVHRLQQHRPPVRPRGAVRHRPTVPLRERRRTWWSAWRSARTSGARCRPVRSRPCTGRPSCSTCRPATRRSPRRTTGGSLVAQQSARCIAAYAYSSAGPGESTTDLVFGGHCLIAENGAMLAESERFRRDEHLTAADIDLDRLRVEPEPDDQLQRRRPDARPAARVPPDRVGRPRSGRPTCPWPARWTPTRSSRPRRAQLRERCEEIFHIQVAGPGPPAGADRHAAGRHRRLRRPRLDAVPARPVQDARPLKASRANGSGR